MYYSNEYYYTDHFRALTDKNNQGSRGHLVFSPQYIIQFHQFDFALILELIL